MGKRINKTQVILWVVIVLQIAILMVNFMQKTETHSDEIWSFGIANNQGNPFIYQTKDEEYYENYYEWVSAEVLHEYLTVQDGEQFDYVNVYQNSKYDMHPPLYYFIIHTISSIFPEQVSLWMLLPINLIALVITQIYLFKLMKKANAPDYVAILTVMLYGLGIGGLSIYIYLRMYALLNMWVVLLLYQHICLYKEQKFTAGRFIAIVLSMVGGCLTQHFFILYAFLLGVYFFFYFLIKKKIKLLLTYCGSMFLGVGLGIGLFPYVYDHLFRQVKGGESTEYPYWMCLVLAFRYMLFELLGFGPNIYQTGALKVCLGILVYLTIIILPLLFVLRKEEKFRLLIKRWKRKIICVCKLAKRMFGQYLFIVGLTFFEITIITCVVAEKISIRAMARTTNRYLFIVYPLVGILVVLLLHILVNAIAYKRRKAKYALMIMVIGLNVLSYVNTSCLYLGKDSSKGIRVETISDANIIILNRDAWCITVLANKIQQSNQYLGLTSREYEDYLDVIEMADDSKPMYLILANNAYISEDMMKKNKEYAEAMKEYYPMIEDLEETFTSLNNVDQFKEIGSCSMTNYGYKIYQLAEGEAK